MSSTCYRSPFVLFVIASAVSPAIASPGATVIFSNIQSSPTSDVPGLPGRKFNPGAGSQFDRPFVSPDGSKWLFRAIADNVPSDLDVVVLGLGLTGAGATLGVKEGDSVPGVSPSATYGPIKTQMGINNAGSWTFSADTTAPTAGDDVVIRQSLLMGSELMAREGQPAPAPPPGLNYGSNDSCNITADDAVWFRTSGLTGALVRLQSPGSGGIVAPGGGLPVASFASNRFRVDADGTHWIYQASLAGSPESDSVTVYDNNVIAQEASILPGSGFLSAVTSFTADAGSVQIGPNGDYAFRGSNADGIDWVYGNGAVLAATDRPIFTGSSELFDDATFSNTFFANVRNGSGHFVIGGVTNAADSSRNAVLVLNGTTLVSREGDPVDVDGDGLFDDDAFISVYNNDDSFLTDDLWYYFMADLRNGAGAAIGQAFLRTPVPEPSTLMLIGLGALAWRAQQSNRRAGRP